MKKLKVQTILRLGRLICVSAILFVSCARKTTGPGITPSPPIEKGAPTLTATIPATPISTETPTLPPATPTEIPSPTEAPPTTTTVPSTGTSIGPENAKNLQLVQELDQPGATQLAWLSSSEIALAGGNIVQLYDLENAAMLTSTTVLTPTQLAVSPNGQWLAAAGQGSPIGVWQLPELTKVFSLTNSADYLSGLVFSNNSQILAASANQSVDLWDLSSGNPMKTTIQTSYMPVVSGFSPDDSQIAITDPEDFRVHFLSLPGGEELRSLQWAEHASPVLYSANLSPDWTTIAWVTRGTIQLQDVQSEAFGAMLNHEDFIIAFDWAPGGNLLASTTGGTVNGQFVDLVYLWDPATGQEVQRLVLPAGGIDLEFSPDGSRLAVLTNQGKLVVWAPGG